MKCSAAAAGICRWAHAMLTYHRVAQAVASKRACLLELSGTVTQEMHEHGEAVVGVSQDDQEPERPLLPIGVLLELGSFRAPPSSVISVVCALAALAGHEPENFDGARRALRKPYRMQTLLAESSASAAASAAPWLAGLSAMELARKSKASSCALEYCLCRLSALGVEPLSLDEAGYEVVEEQQGAPTASPGRGRCTVS